MDIDTTSIHTNTAEIQPKIRADSTNKSPETSNDTNTNVKTTDSVNISEAARDRLRVDDANKSNETTAANETRETKQPTRQQVDQLTASIRENPELALTAQSRPSSLATAQNLIG